MATVLHEDLVDTVDETRKIISLDRETVNSQRRCRHY